MTTPKVAPELADKLVPLASLTPHPRNPREGDVGAISVSLAAFAQYKPIVYQRGTRHILAGNHTWLAARALGWDAIAAVGLDVDDDRATAIMLADNRTSDLGSYDDAALVALARELPGDLLTASGYSADDLDDLLRDLEGDRDDAPAARVTAGAGAAAGEDEVPERFEVLVACETDEAQNALLERLIAEGYECRALVS